VERDALDRRALNRALLARQMLLERGAISALEAVEHLVGLQSQAPQSAYFGLWSRLRGFDPAELSRLLRERRVVRIAVMRNTLHLVSARDALLLRPLVQRIFDRDLATNTTFAPPLRGLDLDEVARAARGVVEEAPRTGTEIGTRLAERWPDRDPVALAHAARNLLPLVQLPPRGLWGESGRTTLTTAEAWLGAPLEPDPSPERMVLRYLGAFGPASVMDLQAWSGLTRLSEVVERLRPRLRVFRDEQRRELFDLRDAPRPGPDAPAPVRLLAEWDNLLFSHADRARITSEPNRKRLWAAGAPAPRAVLVDGFVAGRWRLDARRGTAVLEVEIFGPIPAAERAALEAEAASLLAFAAPEADHELRLRASG
jgi:hypothetical protein